VFVGEPQQWSKHLGVFVFVCVCANYLTGYAKLKKTNKYIQASFQDKC
jgi:hypothetical protein